MNRFFRARLKYLTLFTAGGLADLALAPFYIFPVLLISFPLFFKILDSAENKKQAFKIGWMFGFGYFIFGLYWIANSLLVDAEKFAWLIPFAVCGIPFGLAIFIGLFAVCYHVGGRLRGVFLFATLWVVFELLRTFIFTGFPWNLIGYTALFSIEFAQIGAIGGVYLLSYAVIIISLLPVYYRKRKIVLPVIILTIAGFLYGSSHMVTDQAEIKKAKIVIFQPNIEQSLKWDPLEAKKQFIKSIDYNDRKEFKEADIILWPETGVPYYLNRHQQASELLRRIAPDNGVLVTGGLRSEGEKEDYRVWNALYAVSKEGIYQSYDKIHLVPFGEFVPFRQYLPLEKITPGSMDFSSGGKREVIRYKDGPSFLPLICYEVIFPEFSHSEVKPDLLVNVTNDGWFGDSTGPYQHLAMSQMRAIEQGVPLLRAANTGVSAVIDHNGRILGSLPYNERGFLLANLELIKITTIYSIYGDMAILGLILTSIAILLIFRKKH